MADNLMITTNWHSVNNLFKSFNINYNNNNIERPELEEFVSTESSALLEKGSNTELCEINININPTYSPTTFVLVANCGKLELFVGKLKEYYITPMHELIDDYEGDKTYRFDVQFDKPTTNVTLKFIHQSNSLWIYGVFLNLVKNTNPLESVCESLINFSNVQKMLSESSQNVSSNSSQKCTEFFKLYMSNKTKENMANINNNLNNLQIKETNSNNDIELIKIYFDNKIEILENNIKKHINERLNEFELKQNEKLNDILNLINSKK